VSTHTITSEKFGEQGFPYGTRVRVESVWKEGKRKGAKTYKERRLVWKGDVTGIFTRNFDPGKYVWKAHKHDPAGISGFHESGEFLVGMTQEQWQRISHMEPRNQKATLTTDGIVWSCRFTGCNRMNTSKISAVLHEAEDHYGDDLLKAKNPEAVKRQVDEAISQAVPKVDIAKKIRGG